MNPAPINHGTVSQPTNPSRRSLLGSGLLLAALPGGAWAEPPAVGPGEGLLVARYPESPRDMDVARRFNFPYSLAMLKLALSKVAEPVQTVSVPTELPQSRRFISMRDEGTFDVFWAATSKQLERDHLPIRICLMKGLNGWRIPVVRADQADLLAPVRNLRDLQRYRAGQGYHWIDTEILQAAGIKVEQSSHVERLYGMLAAHRFDYLPRGLQEVWTELESPQGRSFAADRHLIIRYPNPHYFFVRRARPELAALIEQGLEIARRDGSFDELFYRFNLHPLLRAQFGERRTIELPNPLLPAETPLNRKDLWFSAADLKKRRPARQG